MPSIIFLAFGYKYFTQKPIYLVKLGFQNISASNTGSATAAVFESLGEKSNTLSPEEVVAMGKNVDFIQELSLDIRDHPKFKSLDFNSFSGKKRLRNIDVFKQCNNNKDCELGIINSKIGGMFSFSQDNFLDTRFTIDVRNIHKTSALIIVKIIAKKLEERRLRQLQQFIQDQISITQDLASKKKKELEDGRYEEISEEIKQKSILLDGMSTQLKIYQNNYLLIQQQMSHAETILTQTRETLNQDVDLKKLGDSRRAKFLKERIEKLREDITSVELALKFFW